MSLLEKEVETHFRIIACEAHLINDQTSALKWTLERCLSNKGVFTQGPHLMEI